jgi:hypothetical protein
MTHSSLSRPSPDDVRAELRRLLESPFVPEGSLLAKMLTYVVEQTLAGDQRSIKAYTIAVEALGRPANFEPDRDSTVRVAAMRLRNALDLFYGGPGTDSTVRIKMVPGSYRPIFEAVQQPEQDEDEPPSPAAFLRMARNLLSTRALLVALTALMAINFAMTASVMKQQKAQAQAQAQAADRTAAVYELIQNDIQRSFGQALN